MTVVGRIYKLYIPFRAMPRQSRRSSVAEAGSLESLRGPSQAVRLSELLWWGCRRCYRYYRGSSNIEYRYCPLLLLALRTRDAVGGART